MRQRPERVLKDLAGNWAGEGRAGRFVAFNHDQARLGAIDLTRADLWLGAACPGAGVVLDVSSRAPVSGRRPSLPNRLLEITPEFLDIVLSLLRESGFHIIPMDAMPDRLRAQDRRPFAVLTFDDGYRDNADMPCRFFGAIKLGQRFHHDWIRRGRGRASVAGTGRRRVGSLKESSYASGTRFCVTRAARRAGKQAAFDGGIFFFLFLTGKLRGGDEETLLAHLHAGAHGRCGQPRAHSNLCMSWSEITAASRSAYQHWRAYADSPDAGKTR